MKHSNIKTVLMACSLLVPSLANAQQSCCKAQSSTETAAAKPCCMMENNEVIKSIMARRSIRKYKDQQVEHEKLALIARCGINAPSGMNRQEWAVRVVESKEFIDGTTEIFRKENPDMVKRDPNFKNMYRNAPNIIVVAAPEGDGLNVGLMGENMMLAAQSLGLGTCCLGSPIGFLEGNEACKPYLDKLNIPEGYHIAYVLAVGYPDEAPDAKPRDEGKIEYIK